MKKKEDIAVLIKKKLDGMQASSTQPSWESVAGSLKRRRKKRLFVWWTGSVLSLLLIMFLLQNFIGFGSLEQSENKVSTDTTVSTPLSQDVVLDSDINNAESIELPDTREEQSPEDTQATEAAAIGSDNTQRKSTSENISVTQFDSVDLLQGAEVKTTYYYYRDSDQTEIITKDKRVLDSLLEKSAAKVRKDSI